MKSKINEEVIPVVSICCATYNHVHFIRQCLDGFVMQKTKFPFEVLIHDDASTDGTQDIIREYEAKYPDIIKPIYQKENQYSKGVRVSLVYNYSRVRGKYVALCEGDDYWTDPYKLQKQVDFLENHPDYVMCSHRWSEYFEDEKRLSPDIPGDVTLDGRVYTLDNLVRGAWYFQPLTVMYRWAALDLERYSRYKYAKDITLFYVLLLHGKGYCLGDTMAVYRLHSGGVWQGLDLNRQRQQDLFIKLALYEVEKTKEAATFLLQEFTKTRSRIWMLRNVRQYSKIAVILSKHFGAGFALNLFVGKLMRNRNFKFSDFR